MILVITVVDPTMRLVGPCVRSTRLTTLNPFQLHPLLGAKLLGIRVGLF